MKKILSIFKILPIFFMVIPSAYAGGGGAPVPVAATEPTQAANNVLLSAQKGIQGKQLIEQAATAESTLKMLTDATVQSQKIGDGQWTEISSNLSKLAGTVKTGNSLAFFSSSSAEDFKRTFPGFNPKENPQRRYAEWSKTSLDSIAGALAVIGMQAKDFDDEEKTTKSLKTLGQSSAGRMQALQVGNMIATEQVSQTQKLRGLMMAQAQAENAYMATQQQDKDNTRAAEERFFKKTSRKPPGKHSDF
jgi:P-type conjugative transfer protein TrbJ